MQMFYDRYKKPIWLTEYGCNVCSPSATAPQNRVLIFRIPQVVERQVLHRHLREDLRAEDWQLLPEQVVVPDPHAFR
jgi:hypothetical protein